MNRFFLLLVLAVALFGQQQKPAPEKNADAEEQDLSTALAETGSSPVEFVRALEKHLQKYPKTSRRAELERALVKAAIENKDQQRIILYGERVLARDSGDLQILDRVARALLVSDARDTSERALGYARRSEELIRKMAQGETPSRMGKAQWESEIHAGLGRALVLEARATGNLGRLDEAVALARKSYDTYPTGEAAREIARWLARSGKEAEAIPHLADAFTIADPKVTEQERARDRRRMGELYRKQHNSETGLGDLVLQAYDRTSALLAARRDKLQAGDPNAQADKVLDFTLSALDGASLQLSSLRGKAVVFDFWATWCGPCRAQHPLYEEVKKRFHDQPDVVFLSVNTDEEREAVAPFIKAQQWDQKVYFEDGLSRLLKISSIPTTIVMNRHGEVISRMNGFLPERFVDMLTERIHDALKN